MNCIETVKFKCPYCGEGNITEVDCTEKEQAYIEDCEVCCQPMNLQIKVDEQNEPTLIAKHQNQVQ